MTAALDRYRDQRRTDMHARVTRALKDLDTQGLPVNISRVAAAAGVSRQWLYDSPYRTQIEALRSRAHPKTASARPARESATDASLRARLDALHERLKQTRAENAELRTQLERALGLLRELNTGVSVEPEGPAKAHLRG